MLLEARVTVASIIFFYTTSAARLVSSCVHAYHMCVCSLNDRVVYRCNNGSSVLSPETFGLVQLSSWYLEALTLAMFVLMLRLWPAYRISMLVRYHLLRTPETYSIGALVLVNMALEPLTESKRVQLGGVLHTVWLVGFQLVMLTNLLAAVLLVHVNAAALRGAVRDVFPRSAAKRRLCYVCWWSFLAVTVVINFVFAAYIAMVLVNQVMIGRSEFAAADILSLLAGVTLRLLLGRTFFSKLLDWPLRHGLDEEFRVNVEQALSLRRPEAIATRQRLPTAGERQHLLQ